MTQDNHEPLLLVGMGPVEASGTTLDTWATDLDASVAFLQLGTPSLSVELSRLSDEGASSISLVGVKIGRLGPGASWLRRIAAHWWREQVGSPPTIRVGGSLAQTLEDIRTISSTVTPVRGNEPGLTSAAWEDVPGHRHHVFVCWGPRCLAQGGDAAAAALASELSDLGLRDDDVLVTNTGCQFPCNHAPLVTVQPDDVWYGRVDAPAAQRIVREHLADGVPVTDLRLERVRRP